MSASSDSLRPLLPHYNLVIITLDCVRPDFLGCYGCTSVRTPNLDRLAAGGVVFEQAITQAPNTWVSHAGILTGLYPPQHGLRSPYDRLQPEVSSLASLLAAQGYATAGFPGNGLVGSRTGLERGFLLFHEAFGETENAVESWQHGVGAREGDPLLATLPDEQNGLCGSGKSAAAGRGGPVHIQGRSRWDDVLETARHWLSRQQGPVFLWFHYLETHHLPSFELPDYYRYSREPQWQFYEGKVSYADERCVEAVLALLLDWGHFEETLIVVLSDHGEGLAPGRPPAHNGELAEEVLRVPLICYCAGAPWGGVRRPGLVRTADLVPTVLELLFGHNSAAGAASVAEFSGSPLAVPGLECRSPGPAALGRDFAYAENDPLGLCCIRTCEWKLLVRPEGAELYHLATDPAAKLNVIGRHPATAAYLRAILKETRSAGRTAGFPADRSEQETRRLLRSLGYVA